MSEGDRPQAVSLQFADYLGNNKEAILNTWRCAVDADSRITSAGRLIKVALLDLANTLLKIESNKFRDLSAKDPLTNLANRRQLNSQLSMEVDRCARYGESMCLIMLDIDHFKRINDRYGHRVGDRVLVQVARHLEKECRASDLVARYGGEEFTLVLKKLQAECAVLQMSAF